MPDETLRAARRRHRALARPPRPITRRRWRPRPPLRLHDLRDRWSELPEGARQAILYGTGEEKVTFIYDDGLRSYQTTKTFEGVIPNLERRWKETNSAWMREEIERYLLRRRPARPATATRLKPEALAVKIDGLHIAEVAEKSIREAGRWFAEPARDAHRRSRTRSPAAS